MYILHCSIVFFTPNFAFRVSKSPPVSLSFFALFCSCQDFNHFIWELFLLRFYWGCYFISQKVLDSANKYFVNKSRSWLKRSLSQYFELNWVFSYKFHYFEHKLTCSPWLRLNSIAQNNLTNLVLSGIKASWFYSIGTLHPHNLFSNFFLTLIYFISFAHNDNLSMTLLFLSYFGSSRSCHWFWYI